MEFLAFVFSIMWGLDDSTATAADGDSIYWGT